MDRVCTIPGGLRCNRSCPDAPARPRSFPVRLGSWRRCSIHRAARLRFRRCGPTPRPIFATRSPTGLVPSLRAITPSCVIRLPPGHGPPHSWRGPSCAIRLPARRLHPRPAPRRCCAIPSVRSRPNLRRRSSLVRTRRRPARCATTATSAIHSRRLRPRPRARHPRPTATMCAHQHRPSPRPPARALPALAPLQWPPPRVAGASRSAPRSTAVLPRESSAVGTSRRLVFVGDGGC